jgi:hypothetical protein
MILLDGKFPLAGKTRTTGPPFSGKHSHLHIQLHSSRFSRGPLTKMIHHILASPLLYQTFTRTVKAFLAGAPTDGLVAPMPESEVLVRLRRKSANLKLAEREGFEPPRRLRA